MVLIKRYANRKLYNTATRKYVTLDEIGVLLQEGREVQVVDHSTGEDITTATLTQILAHQEKAETGSVPQDLLERMVQLSGLTLNAMKESIQAFLDPIGYFSHELKRRMDILVRSGKITNLERDYWQRTLSSDDLKQAIVKTENEEAAATTEDLQKLINQIDALEARLTKMDTLRD